MSSASASTSGTGSGPSPGDVRRALKKYASGGVKGKKAQRKTNAANEKVKAELARASDELNGTRDALAAATAVAHEAEAAIERLAAIDEAEAAKDGKTEEARGIRSMNFKIVFTDGERKMTRWALLSIAFFFLLSTFWANNTQTNVSFARGYFVVVSSWQEIVCMVVFAIASMAVLVDYVYLANEHRYKTIELLLEDHSDRRSDATSLQKIKHMQAEYGVVRYEHRRYTESLWCGYPFAFMGWSFFATTMDLTVSFELVAQLCNIATVNLTTPDAVIFERLTYLAKGLHTINIDRYKSLDRTHVVQDSVLVAYALYRQYKASRKLALFPRTPAV